MRTVQKTLGISALILVAACGSDDKKDGGSNNSGSGITASGQAIPDTFENKAASPEDFTKSLGSVKTDVLDDAATDLKLGDGGTSLRHLGSNTLAFFGFEGEEEADDEQYDLSGLLSESKEGGDCSKAYESFDNLFTGFQTGFAQFEAQSEKLGEGFKIESAEGYKIEDLKGESGSKYAFHYKLTPEKTDGPFAGLIPTIEVAGGASDDKIAFKLHTTFNFEAEGQGSSKIDTDMTFFGSTGDKTLTMGQTFTVESSADGKTQTAGGKIDTTLVNSDTPSLELKMDMKGEEQKDSKVEMKLTKTGDKTYSMNFKGVVDGQNVAKSLTVTKDDATCKIAGVEG